VAVAAKTALATAIGRPGSRTDASSRQRPFWAAVCFRNTRPESIHAQQPTQVAHYLAHLIAGGSALLKPRPKELACTSRWMRTDTPDADAPVADIGDPNSPTATSSFSGGIRVPAPLVAHCCWRQRRYIQRHLLAAHEFLCVAGIFLSMTCRNTTAALAVNPVDRDEVPPKAQ
jgi:hypothetical protein